VMFYSATTVSVPRVIVEWCEWNTAPGQMGNCEE
jgi:hypothetical protein